MLLFRKMVNNIWWNVSKVWSGNDNLAQCNIPVITMGWGCGSLSCHQAHQAPCFTEQSALSVLNIIPGSFTFTGPFPGTRCMQDQHGNPGHVFSSASNCPLDPQASLPDTVLPAESAASYHSCKQGVILCLVSLLPQLEAVSTQDTN